MTFLAGVVTGAVGVVVAWVVVTVAVTAAELYYERSRPSWYQNHVCRKKDPVRHGMVVEPKGPSA